MPGGVKTHGLPCFALNFSGEVPSCREKHMQEKQSWRQSLMVLFAFILSLSGGINLAGCDINISTTESISAGDEEGDESESPPDPMTEPEVPTSGASNQPEDPTEEPTPTTTVEPEDSGTTTTMWPEPETTGDDSTTGVEEEECGNNGLPEHLVEVLVSPICYEDNPSVEEGWLYSEERNKIHGLKCHRASDFKVPYGTEVRAMADGWCLASFESLPADNLRGKKIGMGGGLLVVCWNYDLQIFMQYLHLSGLGPNIPYYTPDGQIVEGLQTYTPTIIRKPADKFVVNAVFIEEGELIGYVGVSGLSEDANDPPSKSPDPVNSWDGPHLHVQIHGDRDSKGNKNPDTIYDMFNLYWNYEDYWSVFEFCTGMMSCDLMNAPAPQFPWQCNGIPFDQVANDSGVQLKIAG